MPRLGPPQLDPSDQTPSQIGLETFGERHVEQQKERLKEHREIHGTEPAQWERLGPRVGPPQPEMTPQERMQTHHQIVREAIEFYRGEIGGQREHAQQRRESGVPTLNPEAERIEQTRLKDMSDKMTQIEALMRGQALIPQDRVDRHRDIFKAINERLDDVMQLYGAPPRPDMERIRNVDDLRPRMPHQTLGLGQDGLYRLSDPDGLGGPALANGGYVFVVPVNNPSEIWIGARANGGHTAISRGGDVYFAGEIEFDQGRLVSWNNNSGHYRPSAHLHAQIGNAAIGTLETLLPRDKFAPIQL